MKLELENVVKKYGEIIALNEFSYVFDNGIYGIWGINGAGKSTLFNLLTDNLKPNGGNIKLDDKDIYLLGDNYRKRVGYMPQQQGFYDKMTGYAYLKKISTEKIVLIATHIVSDVESLADKVIIMKSGSISVSGTIAEVKEKNDITNLEDLFVTE